jgi:polyisoprenyl-teichoic acid--peptidoglycan teichoic acid transferase
VDNDRPSTRSPLRNPAASAGSASVPSPGSGRGTGRPPSGPPPTGRATAGRPGAPVAKSKRRKPFGSVMLIVVGVLLVLVSGGTYAAVNTAITKVSKAIPTAHLLGTDAATATSINGVINILLIGVDTRPGNTIGSRSDSIIIAHIPASHDRVYLVSIPRDTQANIPGHGSNKINSAFYFGSSNGGGYAGGAQLLTKTLKSDYGLTFNAAAIVNFSGFEDIVKALGGVTMYVDERTKSLHHGYKIVNGKRVIAAPYVTYNKGLTWKAVPGVTPVIYTKGTHHLTAYEALDYVRIRDFLPNGDYDRERHQQQFIKAVMQEAVSKGMSNLLNADKFLGSISKAFIWDGGNQPMSNWIFTLKSINPSSMMTIKTNNGTFNSQTINGSSYEVLSPTSKLLLKDVKNDNLDAFLAAHPTWLTTK